MELKINVTFNLWDKVYLRHDPEQREYYVTGILVKRHRILYEISSGMNCVLSPPDELSFEKSII